MRQYPNQKPPFGTPIDWGNPLTKALFGCWDLNENGGDKIWDAANSAGTGTFVNAPTWGRGAEGTELKFVAASSQYVNIPAKGLWFSKSYTAHTGEYGWTMMCRFRMNSLRNYNGIFTNNTSNNSDLFDMYVDSGGTLNWGASGVLGVQTLAGFSANKWYTVVLTVNSLDQKNSGNGSARLYVNGVQKVLYDQGSTPLGQTDPFRPLVVGARDDHATLMDGSIAFARVWRRPLTSAEVSQLQSNPYQIYKPKVRKGFAVNNTTTTQTLTGKGRIQITTTQTLSGKAAIRTTTTQTLTGKGRIQITTTQILNGKARIGLSTSQTLTGKSRLQITTTKTLSGKAAVQGGSTQTLIGTARIRVTTTQTLGGMARILFVTTQNLTGKSRIQLVTSQTLSGKGRIKVTVTQTLSGKARVGVSTTQILSGKANIFHQPTVDRKRIFPVVIDRGHFKVV